MDSGLVRSPSLPSSISVGANITFECEGGMRMRSDVHKVTTDGVECIGGDNWDEPEQWDECVECEFVLCEPFIIHAYFW